MKFCSAAKAMAAVNFQAQNSIEIKMNKDRTLLQERCQYCEALRDYCVGSADRGNPTQCGKKNDLDVDRLLRNMIELLPLIYMPQNEPPTGSPDAILWGRHRTRYTIWLQFKSGSHYQLFAFSSWQQKGDANRAAIQAANRYPDAVLRYLKFVEVRALLKNAD